MELQPGNIEDFQKKWSLGHGPELKATLEALPQIKGELLVDDGVVAIESSQSANLTQAIKSLGPWRKGPFRVLGHSIDSEWRSDLKWERLISHLPDLEDKNILDIGCNNGYFMFRMLEQNPAHVLGIDPTLVFKAQFEFLQHFLQDPRLEMQLWGIEHLNLIPMQFDVIFSMGILYHHRDPIGQLFEMRKALKSKGTLILETIYLDQPGCYAMTPADRYAGMRNVWLLPTLDLLVLWLEKNKFTDIEIVSTQWGGVEEQRQSDFSSSKSYQDFIDPQNPSKTIEGHPAPKRVIIRAKNK